MAEPVTVKDIARELGVSAGTVSKALNGRPDVGPGLRARVQECAERLGYLPDPFARRLVGGSSRLIGVFVLSRDRIALRDNFAIQYLDGVLDEIERRDFDALFFSMTRESGEASYLRRCRAKRVEGAVFIGLSASDPRLAELASSELPVSLIDIPLGLLAPPSGAQVSCVLSDNAGGVRSALAALSQAGRARIAFLAAPDDSPVARERREAYEAFMAEAGLPPRILPVCFDSPSGAEAARVLIAEAAAGRPLPDAVLASSDAAALGCQKELLGAGVRVPGDLAVCGFDDIPAAALVHPGLGTVRQDAMSIGRAAARALFERIGAAAPVPPQEIRIPTELAVRESMAAQTNRRA